MRRRCSAIVGLGALAALAATGCPSATRTAGKAPPITPDAWLNSVKPVTWEGLKGRLILVEKWATW